MKGGRVAWIRWFASDYISATRSLSMLQHGAYLQLLNELFATQKPLPQDMLELYRIGSAHSQDEKEALKCVLHRKFKLTEEGWAHDRAFVEVENAIQSHEKRSDSGRKGGFASALLRNNSSIGAALVDEPEPEPEEEQKNTSKEEPSTSGLDFEGAWNYYLNAVGKNPKQNTFTTARKNQLQRRFDERVKIHDGDISKAKIDVRNAIDALAEDDFHNARGEHKGKKKFNSFEIIFRSQSQFEKWLPEGEEE